MHGKVFVPLNKDGLIPHWSNSSKRATHWVGYKVHLTEICDAGQPDLITQVITTPATTPDCVMGATIHHGLAQRYLVPGTHLLETGATAARPSARYRP
jgi:transposase